MTFGAAAYHDMMDLPPRAIIQLARAQHRRVAQQQLQNLRHLALADGLELGRRYVPDPSEPKSRSRAHYDLAAYNAEIKALLHVAYPEASKTMQTTRIKDNERKWQAMRRAMSS